MGWIQRYSRVIASTALAAMVLPFAVSGISTATRIPSVYLAVGLTVLVAGGLIWMAIRAKNAEDGPRGR